MDEVIDTIIFYTINNGSLTWSVLLLGSVPLKHRCSQVLPWQYLHYRVNDLRKLQMFPLLPFWIMTRMHILTVAHHDPYTYLYGDPFRNRQT
jgi:hypothetical protein